MLSVPVCVGRAGRPKWRTASGSRSEASIFRPTGVTERSDPRARAIQAPSPLHRRQDCQYAHRLRAGSAGHPVNVRWLRRPQMPDRQGTCHPNLDGARVSRRATHQRRVAAILALDVVGFSAAIGANASGTIERVRQLRRDLIEPPLLARGGRLFKTTGDGFLAEFGSALDPVMAADTMKCTTRRPCSPPGRRDFQFIFLSGYVQCPSGRKALRSPLTAPRGSVGFRLTTVPAVRTL